MIASLDALDYPSCNTGLGNRLALVGFDKGYEQLVSLAEGLGPITVGHESPFDISGVKGSLCYRVWLRGKRLGALWFG